MATKDRVSFLWVWFLVDGDGAVCFSGVIKSLCKNIICNHFLYLQPMYVA